MPEIKKKIYPIKEQNVRRAVCTIISCIRVYSVWCQSSPNLGENIIQFVKCYDKLNQFEYLSSKFSANKLWHTTRQITEKFPKGK